MEKALAVITRNSAFVPSPNPRTQISSLLPQSLSLRLLRNHKRSLGLSGRIRCSLDFGNSRTTATHSDSGYCDGLVGAPQYPKPSDVPWNKELCNSVHLIGIVATPVQIKHLSSGKVVAWSRLAVRKSPTDTSWINLTFWDELAHVASQHVEKGHQIYVSGRLVADTVENNDGKQQTYFKVVVQQLNFVERSFPSVPLYDGDTNIAVPGRGRKPGNFAANSSSSTEQLWQAFFANPLDWWDNRETKRSPNYPDFKHKDTGEALWVEGRNNPPWVKSQLAILDTKMESFHDQNASIHASFMAGDNYTTF